jgi:DNA invertase Pin-like site-specific DNA recombinase
MNSPRFHHKLTADRLGRKAVVYLRQSSARQVRHNTESQRLQYALVERAHGLGWVRVEVIDRDLGCSASTGAPPREGFDQLLATVARGEVGVVLSREVSRLSRTDKDWCHLLEVCRLFDTLLADADQVYDLNCMDDQLVLGIKGTMSVVELNILKMRMLEGQEEKARRGELFRMLPPGYVLDGSGGVVKDPDLRIQEAIALIFTKYRELWSIRQTVKWFHDEEVELPVNRREAGRVRLAWQLPTYALVSGVLHNPFYGGAYTYGRRHRVTVLEEGQLRKKTGRVLAPEECRVFIREHHEGYIDWAAYKENQQQIRSKSLRMGGDPTVTAVREGHGLLAGLLRCGRCGRKLHVRYWGKSGTAARYLCKGDFDTGGSYCLGFGGATVDRRFSEQILSVLSPLGIEAGMEALDRFGAAQKHRTRALTNQLAQAEYEARRAFEQYDEVDARNRLVASQLEQRWEQKLAEVERLSRAVDEADQEAPSLGQDERHAILALGRSFAGVWRSDSCPIALKKKIVQTVVKEVIVDLDDTTQELSLVIHWAGGTHTRFLMDKPKSGVGRKTAVEDLEIIRRMAERYGDPEITRVLNKLGRRTATGRRWSQQRVTAARRTYSIPGRKRTIVDPNVMSLARAAKHCAVSDTTIKRLVDAGKLPMKQVVPWAPWEIQRKDLDSKPVKTIVDRLLSTGKLVLDGDESEVQIEIFQ